MTIELYNTRTRRKERFEPLDPSNVRMYVCGPTVYDRAHIGNARPVVVFDVLYRLLRHVYGPGRVTYVRNITDVDDKIIARAQETLRAGETLEAATRRITDETIGWYHEDMAALGALPPTHEPRCTEYIPQMVEMTRALVEKGVAYVAEGHVLFEVAKWPRYGELSGRSTDDMIAGARVEVAPYKRSPMDFVLWKPSTPDQPGWPSPWSRGRPGWHIECSAMAEALLGREFDIHGGGIDLAFPHHENELAQSCCVHGTERMAQLWMHNGFLQVEGEKMSKSLGNFFTVRDLLDRGIPGEVIRFVLLSTHYRQPMDWTEKKVEEATNTLRRWATVADEKISAAPDAVFVEELSDDLNTWEAITRLNELFDEDNRVSLIASARLLGFDLASIAQSIWARRFEFQKEDGSFLREGIDYQPTVAVFSWGEIGEDTRESALQLVRLWLKERREKNWEKADALRASARSIGIELRATRSPNGVNGGLADLHRHPRPADIERLLT
jgi:cysteinyl-tRNA synthetase